MNKIVKMPEFPTLVALLQARSISTQGYTFLPEGDVLADGGAGNAAAAEQHLSFATLELRARAIAAHLQEQRLAGQRALLLYPPGLDYLSAFFGCLYAGVIAVPVYPPHRSRPDLRLQAILRDAQPAIALMPAEMLGDREALLKHNPAMQSLQWLATDTLANDAAAAWHMPEIDGETLAFLQYTSGSTGDPKGVMLTHRNLLHNSALIHSAFGHDDNARGVIWLPPFHDMGLIGGILQPLYGDVPVTLMAPVSFLQRPLRWLQAISHYRATSSGGPNFAYDLCVRKITPEQRTGLDLSSWEVAFCGAEPIQADTLNRFADAFAECGFRREAFFPCYGLAEATLFVSGGPKLQPVRVHALQDQALSQNKVLDVNVDIHVDVDADVVNTRSIVNCGVVGPTQHVRIVNPETRQQCASDEIGEIWLRGASVAKGYWQRAEETQYAFAAQLADDDSGAVYLRTGDLGFIKDNGLCITGRLKDLIIVRGRNHYPQDLEATMAQAHPITHGSFNAAFSVQPQGDSEERVVIVCEIERTQLRKLNDAADAVYAAARSAIATAHGLQLHAIVLVRPGSLPKTSSGKVQRRATRKAYLANELNVVTQWCTDTVVVPIATSSQQPAPAAALAALPALLPAPDALTIQRWMTQWLANRLRMPLSAIDPQRPFADYGLDSLAAVEMAQALSDWLHQPHTLKATLAWDFPTPMALANYLAHSTDQSAAPPAVPVVLQSRADDVLSPKANDDLAAQLAQELAQLERLL